MFSRHVYGFKYSKKIQFRYIKILGFAQEAKEPQNKSREGVSYESSKVNNHEKTLGKP